MTRTAARCPLWFASVIALLAASCRSQPALTEEAWDKAHKPVIPYHRTRPLFPPNWPDGTRQFPVEQPGESDWRMHFNERLQEPVSFDFDATPLDDVVAFLRTMKKVSFDVDRRAVRDRGNLDVTMRVDNVPFSKALSQILQLLELDYTLRDGAVYVTTRDRLVAWYNAPTVRYDPAEWKPLEPIMRRTISFDFHGEQAEEVFASLEKRMGVPIILEQPLAKRMGVGLRVRDMQFRHALAWICCQLDLAYTIRDGKILISNPETLALTEEEWDKAHKMVIPYFRTRPLFPPNWPDTTREFPVEQPGESDWPMSFNKKLQEPISFDFVNTPLDDVVAFLRTMRKVSVVLDKGTLGNRAHAEVTLRVDNIPFHEALRQILKPLGLEYTAYQGLFISTREEILELSNAPTVYYDPVEWKPLEPIMRKRISFEFRGELPREVFESLQKQIGVPIIAGEPGKMRGVNLKVQDMQVRYALAWVCEELTMAYSVRDGKIIVSGR